MRQSCGGRTFGKGEHLNQSDMHKSIGQDVIHRIGLRVGQCHCKSICYNLWEVMVIRGGSWWLEKRHMSHVFLKKVKKEDPGSYKPVGLTFQSLERLWRTFPGTKRTRGWFGTASMALPRADHASPTWFSSTMRWLAQGTVGEQQMLTFGGLLTQSPIVSLQSDIDCRVGWEKAEICWVEMTVTVDYNYLRGRYKEDFLPRAAQNQEKDVLQHVALWLYVRKTKSFWGC